MTLPEETRHVLGVLLNEWRRGERALEELYDEIAKLVRGEVTTQPAPTPDQLAPPPSSG
jgi:hypothetical protein